MDFKCWCWLYEKWASERIIVKLCHRHYDRGNPIRHFIHDGKSSGPETNWMGLNRKDVKWHEISSHVRWPDRKSEFNAMLSIYDGWLYEKQKKKLINNLINYLLIDHQSNPTSVYGSNYNRWASDIMSSSSPSSSTENKYVRFYDQRREEEKKFCSAKSINRTMSAWSCLSHSRRSSLHGMRQFITKNSATR